MFRIEASALYSLEDLERELGDAIGVRAFLDRLKPAKRFRDLFYGRDLLDALDRLPAMNESHEFMGLPSGATRRDPARRNGQIPMPKKVEKRA